MLLHDEMECNYRSVYLTRVGSHSKKADKNVSMHAQQISIEIKRVAY